MKAFISYSVTEDIEYIVTSLSLKLRDQGFIPTTSINFFAEELDHLTMNEIDNSNLFVGLITKGSKHSKRVSIEWNYAFKRNVPNVLLIEDTIKLPENFGGNYVRFNRLYPKAAFDKIHEHMNPKKPSNTKATDIVPWILGGAALIAVLSILTKED